MSQIQSRGLPALQRDYILLSQAGQITQGYGLRRQREADGSGISYSDSTLSLQQHNAPRPE